MTQPDIKPNLFVNSVELLFGAQGDGLEGPRLEDPKKASLLLGIQGLRPHPKVFSSFGLGLYLLRGSCPYLSCDCCPGLLCFGPTNKLVPRS